MCALIPIILSDAVNLLGFDAALSGKKPNVTRLKQFSCVFLMKEGQG